jgi:hypothetical protein
MTVIPKALCEAMIIPLLSRYFSVDIESSSRDNTVILGSTVPPRGYKRRGGTFKAPAH